MRENAQTDKKSLIIQAAITVLTDGNYETMKTARVASVAGVAEGTIYRYFKNKRELFIEVLRMVCGRLEELFFIGLGDAVSLEDKIAVLARNFLQRGREADSLFKIFYKAFSEVDDPGIKTVLGDIFQNGINEIRKILREGLERQGLDADDRMIELAAIMLWGMGDIFWKRDLVSYRQHVSEEEVKGLIAKLFRALMGKEGGR